MTDQTQDFLQKLPEIKPNEAFWFACHPKIPCFNACCSDLNMPLTPYDVLRLCQSIDLNSDAFIDEYARVSCYPDTGFPVIFLRMDEDIPDAPCPFVTQKGCGVYLNRSSACRTYPLGRATRQAEANKQKACVAAEIELEEHYFLVREDHCKGFQESAEWTNATWLQDQGLTTYNAINDAYSRLIALYRERANGAILSGKHATMALLCLYQQDRFKDFMLETNLVERLHFIGPWGQLPRKELEERFLTDATLRLELGLAWLELLLFRKNDRISPNM